MPFTSASVSPRLITCLGLAVFALAGCRGKGPELPAPDTSSVGIGYGTQPQSDVTGSISSVSGEEARRTKATNVADMIEGRFPGVEVSRLASGGISIRIRGSRSLNGNNEPLLVLDGVPMSGTSGGILNDLDPRDIKSIEVLKDASTTSAFGARGANGVILIRTMARR
jgi:TonB-dependent starch-binding outer membrane protein SusC